MTKYNKNHYKTSSKTIPTNSTTRYKCNPKQ